MSGFHAEPAMAPWVIAAAATLVGVVTDLRSRRLPNWLTLPLLLAALMYGGLRLPGSTGLGGALLGCLVAGLPFVILWVVGGGGAGDAKMMLALGAWLGPYGAMHLVFCVAVAGGILAIALALLRGRLIESFVQIPRAVAILPAVLNGPGRLEDRREIFAAVSNLADSKTAEADAAAGNFKAPRTFKLPYGVAICVGTFVAGWWLWLR